MRDVAGKERDRPLPAQGRRLLVLRPEPGASATIARAATLGLKTVAIPLFTVVSLAWEAPEPGGHDALMLTSANALRDAGPALARYRTLPTYAVGEATAAAARAAGFGDVRVGDKDAVALLERMAADGVRRPLHLAGREHREAGHPALTITRRTVYAADPVEALPVLADGVIALLHSPRAGRVFAGLVEDRSTIAIAAISPAVAHAAGDGWQAVAIAAAPNDAALLGAVLTLLG